MGVISNFKDVGCAGRSTSCLADRQACSDALNYQFLFDETDDKFKVGPQGSLLPKRASSSTV